MKVLLLNGSPQIKGSTNRALSQIAKYLEEEGIESEIFYLGAKPVRDCIGCGKCSQTGKCIFDDDIVNELIEKAKDFDGFVFGTPVYYAHPSGLIQSVLDRAFYAGGINFRYKPACAVAIARRSGTTASLDVLNKYFTINSMPVVSSQYWNNAFGRVASDLEQDKEGMQIMQVIAYNMSWLLKCIELGKQKGITPKKIQERIYTNYVR